MSRTDQPRQHFGDRQPTRAKQDKADELTYADELQGRNSLQGDDQANVRNERHAVPDAKAETDGVVESFEKLDKDVRARTDLNKGVKSKK